jgi:diguanylate cyclase (GGDEF)-like protein
MAYDYHDNLASWTRTHTVINEIFNMINFEFDLTKVVNKVLESVEQNTNCRGVGFSEVGFTGEKKLKYLSPHLSQMDIADRQPIISLPITLINNRITHTMDVYTVEENILPRRDTELLFMFRDLLGEAINKEAVKRDSLTGLYDRSYFDNQLQLEILDATKENWNVGLIILDIDHFKQVNDTYGHPVGDLVLQSVARVLMETIGEKGICARYGGEEMAIILPKTNQENAIYLAEEIRSKIEAQAINTGDEPPVKITVSLGIAMFPQDSREINTLIKNADKALYQAKEAGRNKVSVFSTQLVETPVHRIGEKPAGKKEVEMVVKSALPLQGRLKVISLIKREQLSQPITPNNIFFEEKSRTIYLVDSVGSRIFSFNSKGEFITKFGGKGEGRGGRMNRPTSIACDRAGYIWVADSENHCVKKFDQVGNCLLCISSTLDEMNNPLPSPRKGSFNLPYALAFERDGNLLVVERMNRRVQRFDPTGNYLAEINIPQLFPGYPLRPDPTDICVDGVGNYVILDAANNCLLKFNRNDEIVSRIGHFGTKAGEFSGLSGIDADPTGRLTRDLLALCRSAEKVTYKEGTVLVTAEMGDHSRIQFFDAGGSPLEVLDLSTFDPNSGPIRPRDVLVDSQGHLLVLCQEPPTLVYLLVLEYKS